MMNSYDEIRTNVIKCSRCELRQDLIKTYRDICDYSSFGFYYSSRDDAEKSKYIMIMQNPGLPDKWDSYKEYEEYSKIKDGDDFVPTMQKYLINWLEEHNKHFSEPFFNILREYHLIDYNNIEDYLEGKFLSEFLVTDLVKCRAKTEKIGGEQITTCAEYYLFKELIETMLPAS